MNHVGERLMPFLFYLNALCRNRRAPVLPGLFYLIGRPLAVPPAGEGGASPHFVQCFHVDAAFSHGATDYYNIPLTGPTLGWI